MNDQDVRDLLALAEAARNVGFPLIPLALDIRAANRKAEHAARRSRLTNPDWSIVYIGAILRDSANRYEQSRGRGNDGRRFDVSQDIGVLLTFYEGVDGGPEGAAARDKQRSKGPEMGDDMGPWVVDNLPWVREQLPCLE